MIGDMVGRRQPIVVALSAKDPATLPGAAAKLAAAIAKVPGIEPSSVELWQGQADRLHDRLRYCRDGDGWLIERLSP